MKTTLLAMLAVLTMSVAAADDKVDLPPTFLSAVAMYAPDGTFVKLEVGNDRFTSCRDALDDTMSAIARASEFAPPGARTIGQCIPIRTYAVRDLMPEQVAPTVSKPATVL